MSTMIMLVGCTGAGKSTYRKEQLAQLPCISPDDFIVGSWTSPKVALAWAYARATAIELLMAKPPQDFIVDAQFINPLARNEWIALGQRFEWEVELRVIHPSFRTIIEHQIARGARGHYGRIPWEVVRKSYRQLRKQLAAGGFGSTATRVVLMTGGACGYCGDWRPASMDISLGGDWPRCPGCGGC